MIDAEKCHVGPAYTQQVDVDMLRAVLEFYQQHQPCINTYYYIHHSRYHYINLQM